MSRFNTAQLPCRPSPKYNYAQRSLCPCYGPLFPARASRARKKKGTITWAQRSQYCAQIRIEWNAILLCLGSCFAMPGVPLSNLLSARSLLREHQRCCTPRAPSHDFKSILNRFASNGGSDNVLSNLLSACSLLSPKGASKMLRATGHARMVRQRPRQRRCCARRAMRAWYVSRRFARAAPARGFT